MLRQQTIVKLIEADPYSGFFSGQFERRIKNVVPQRVAYPEAPVILLVMMQHVVLFDTLPEWMTPAKMVHGVVHHVVAQITEQKSREEWINRRFAYNRLETEEE